MIFTESTIKISNNVSKMDSTIVLYRGDKNVEIRFTILQSPFKYSNTVATNVIESTNASYGQLVIKTPNDKPPIFSEVSATKEGTVLFTITKEMIDEIEELGVYTFQIRLMDENKQSRVTIPPVENGIEIKEPIAIEDDNTTNVVGLAKANYAVVTSSDVDTPTFDDNGKYNKTNWNDGDIITNASLNKIEDGIYTTNENIVIRPLPVHTIQETTAIVIKVVNIMDLIDGVTYSTHKDLNETRRQSYRVAYVCDDGSFKAICTLSLTNKIVHLVKVIHFAQNNYSVLSDNNTVYTVDYSKHSTNTDIQITKTLQNYLPINNTTEYNPTKEYHPATKKYVDDRFICTDIVDNVGTISKEEMQKCNNGTSRYVSSINFKEFFADYEHCVYQGTYGDKNILMKYDAQYNRIIAYDLTDVIMLGFDFNTNYMYPFNAGSDEVKAYQFTNDLVITKSPALNPSEVLTKNNTHEYTPTNDYNPATKKYVDDKVTVKILPVDYDKNCATNVADLEPHSIYMSPNDANFLYLGYEKLSGDFSGFFLSGNPHGKFIYTGAKDDTKIEVMLEGICYTAYFKTDTVDAHTEKTVFYLTKNNNKEFTPTTDYEPATKKYVDDNILPEQLPILRIDETNKRIYVNCNNMGTYKKYFVPNKYANVYGFSFIYTNEDSSETEIALVGGAMTRDDFILCARNTNTLFILILGGTDKYTYTKSTKTLEKGLYGYLKIGNTQEYTPTENYHPATKKYVDDNLTTIKEGITTSDAELIDARTDAEGVVHTNVGDALRATDKKINRIKEDIDYTVIENTSKISVALKEENTELLENKLYTTDGTIETSDRYSTLYYKLDKNAVSVDLRKIKIGVYGGAFVTKDKTWISSFETTGADIDTSVPKNAYYIGISVSNEWKYVHTLPITIRNNSVKFNNLNIDNIQIPASNPCNHWKGKKILWLGTSVSYGSNATTSYAVEACNILECNLLNTSMPGLAIHTQADGTKMTYGSTTLSKAEYKAQGVTIPDSPNTYIPGGDNYNDYYRTWENIFNDSTKDYDLYVFDVLPNNTEFKLDDWDAFNKDKWEYTDGSSFADHRTTFIGALLFLLDKLYEINPMARVVFVLGSEFQYWTKNTSFKPVAEQYRIGVIDIWSKVNLTPKSKLQILSKDGTDNHPSTYAHKLLGQILANELLLIR